MGCRLIWPAPSERRVCDAVLSLRNRSSRTGQTPLSVSGPSRSSPPANWMLLLLKSQRPILILLRDRRRRPTAVRSSVRHRNSRVCRACLSSGEIATTFSWYCRVSRALSTGRIDGSLTRQFASLTDEPVEYRRVPPGQIGFACAEALLLAYCKHAECVGAEPAR